MLSPKISMLEGNNKWKKLKKNVKKMILIPPKLFGTGEYCKYDTDTLNYTSY